MNNEIYRANVERFVESVKLEERFFGVTIFGVNLSVRFKDYVNNITMEYIKGQSTLINHDVGEFTVSNVMVVLDNMLSDFNTKEFIDERMPVALTCIFTYYATDRRHNPITQELMLWKNDDSELINTARMYTDL